MKTQFTKGPWGILGGSIIDSDVGTIAVIPDHSQPNLALIAVAPEMYDFIESIENDLGLLPEFMVKKRNEILAKARGEK